MFDKLKSAFYENSAERRVSPRQARLLGADEAKPEKMRLKGWVKQLLSTAPWAAVAIVLALVLFQGFLPSALGAASSALVYGLMKMATAVIVTVIADETMFNGFKQPTEHAWLPMIRRSMVFLGVCWIMAVV